MKKLVLLSIPVLVFSCKKKDETKPQNVLENEIITTVTLVAKDSVTNEVITATWRDLANGKNGIIKPSNLNLKPSSTYFMNVLLLDETKNPADTISNEVSGELAEEHQLFYTFNPSKDISIMYADKDKNNVPVGIKTKLKTTTAGSFKLNTILKHQPDVKPKSGMGDKNLGSTDMNLDFDISVSSPK